LILTLKELNCNTQILKKKNLLVLLLDNVSIIISSIDRLILLIKLFTIIELYVMRKYLSKRCNEEVDRLISLLENGRKIMFGKKIVFLTRIKK